jgi:hypothetical protein
MLGNSIGLLTLALMIASEGRNASGAWRYGLFALAALVAIGAAALKQITDEMPSVGTFLSGVFGSPVSWFVIFVALFFVLRPIWQGGSGSRLPPQYDDATTKAELADLDAKIADLRTTMKGATEALLNPIAEGKASGQVAVDELVRFRHEYSQQQGFLMKRLDRMEADGSLQHDYVRRQIASLYQALAAIAHLEKIQEVAAEIEALGQELATPTTAEDYLDADKWEWWEEAEAVWMQKLRFWCALAGSYDPALEDDVMTVSELALKHGTGIAQANQFPTSEAYIWYKTFAIRLIQWRANRIKGEDAIRDHAFNGATASERPLIVDHGKGDSDA